MANFFKRKVELTADQYSELRNELAQIIAADFKDNIGSQIIHAKSTAFEEYIRKAAEAQGRKYAEEVKHLIRLQYSKWEKDQNLRKEINEVKKTQANFQTEIQTSIKEIMELLQALMNGQERPEKNKTLEEILERLTDLETRLDTLEKKPTYSAR